MTSRWSRDQRVMWLKQLEHFILIQKAAWFGVQASSAGRDLMYVISHVTSHEHLIEGSCEYMVGSSLVVIGLLQVERFNMSRDLKTT